MTSATTRPLRLLSGLAAAVSLAACAGSNAPSGDATSVAPSQDPLVVRGEVIASELCSSCHAIGLTGESLHPDAKPFRLFSRNYPIETLAEPLAEGIVVGHPDMPAWSFEPDEIDALLAYLESVQQLPG